MRRVAVVIFELGVFINVAAFLLSKVEEVPFVYSVVALSYLAGRNAIRVHETESDLLPGMPGFEVSANLYLTGLRRDYPVRNFTEVYVTGLHHPPKVSQDFSIKKGVSFQR